MQRNGTEMARGMEQKQDEGTKEGACLWHKLGGKAVIMARPAQSC